MTKVLISIVGPTAIGKTSLSLKLAAYFNAEIISADSRQFYKEMHIGTAVPTPKELQTIKHHFIQHRSIYDNYSVGDFERDAIKKITELHKTHKYVVMLGGSGLYVKAITSGLDYFPEVNPKVRADLNSILKTKGLKVLQERLRVLDPLAYKTIAIDNPQRVVRALEICEGTHMPYSSYLTNTAKARNFKTIAIGLNAERPLIYDKINKRVDIMIANGLFDEAKQLFPHKNLNALNTVGYKELFAHFEGKSTLDFAISEIKKNTRRFAKRQLTWFRKDKSIKWFNHKTHVKEILAFIENEV